MESIAEVSGCLSAAGLVIILTVCLSMYGGVSFDDDKPSPPRKTLSGRDLPADELQSADGYALDCQYYVDHHATVGMPGSTACNAGCIMLHVCHCVIRLVVSLLRHLGRLMFACLQMGWLHLWLVDWWLGWRWLGICLLSVPPVLLLDL